MEIKSNVSVCNTGYTELNDVVCFQSDSIDNMAHAGGALHSHSAHHIENE